MTQNGEVSWLLTSAVAAVACDLAWANLDHSVYFYTLLAPQDSYFDFSGVSRAAGGEHDSVF